MEAWMRLIIDYIYAKFMKFHRFFDAEILF